jgi:hypothetical protein
MTDAPVTQEHREAACVALYGDAPWKHRQILTWLPNGEINDGVPSKLPRVAQAIADAEARVSAARAAPPADEVAGLPK